MASVINSQSMILTTAMAVSGAVLVLSLCRIRNFPTTIHDLNSQSPNYISPSLRSCLSSDGKRREKKKKKKVKFADNVKDERSKANNEKKYKKDENFTENEEIPEFRRMPANRAALYQGILRDRVHRIECSY